MNAFVQTPHALPRSSSRTARCTRRQTPVAQRVKAPAVDSRVQGATESHHWIHVSKEHTTLFERAALANADVTRRLEARTGEGAERRWVLKQVADPSLGFMDGNFDTGNAATYVVMEQFATQATTTSNRNRDRWLSSVRHAGPALGALDIATCSYASIFAARRHNASPDEHCLVVVEAVQALPAQVDAVEHILSTGAEAAVAAAEALEVDVLQSSTAPAYFKCVTVYQDVEQMLRHVDGGYKAFKLRSRGKLVDAHQGRQTFKPTLLA